MIRQDIRIGSYNRFDDDQSTSYKFVVDLYKHGIDFIEDVKRKFVMLRRYEVMNNIARDTDIYFIEEDYYENNFDDIVWPVTNQNYQGFSTNYENYNYNFNEKTVHGDEVYKLYTLDPDVEEADVPCDKIRIYHPHNLTTINGLVYIKATVASINVHLLCRPYKSYKTNAETEFFDENLYFSEYIELLIPNLEYLMSGKVYYIEDINLVNFNEDNPSDMSLLVENTDPEFEGFKYLYMMTHDGYKILLSDYKDSIYATPDATYVALKMFNTPWLLEHNGNDVYIKLYDVNAKGTVSQNESGYPIQITIYPYTGIDDTTKLYIEDETLIQNSDIFYNETIISIASKFGFDENGGIPSIINTFTFPHIHEFDNIRDAYEYYYHVDLNEYNGIVNYDEEDEDPDDYVEEKQCGFVLTLYSDYYLTQKITNIYYEIENPNETLDNFIFQLKNIFTNWVQLPDILVCRVKFIDKYLGNIIYGNPVALTKDMFKYLINDADNKSRLTLTGEQKKLKHITDMDFTNTNYIDKVTCIIRKKDDNKETVTTEQRQARVLYKPVFYRTQDLQNITLRQGVVQNIGIALAEYMTKVDTFKLLMDGNQYIETARNDIYVIFNVDATTYQLNQQGNYNITNQDDEYISSGKYIVK